MATGGGAAAAEMGVGGRFRRGSAAVPQSRVFGHRQRSLSDGDLSSLADKTQHAWEDEMESLLAQMFHCASSTGSGEAPDVSVRHVKTHLQSMGLSDGALAYDDNDLDATVTDISVRRGSLFNAFARDDHGNVHDASRIPQATREMESNATEYLRGIGGYDNVEVDVADSADVDVDVDSDSDSCSSRHSSSSRSGSTMHHSASWSGAYAAVSSPDASACDLIEKIPVNGNVTLKVSSPNRCENHPVDRGNITNENDIHHLEKKRVVLSPVDEGDPATIGGTPVDIGNGVNSSAFRPTPSTLAVSGDISLEKRKQALVALSFEKNFELIRGVNSVVLPPGLNSRLRKAFTVFHNKQSDSSDTGVAYLGDEKSVRSGNLFLNVNAHNMRSNKNLSNDINVKSVVSGLGRALGINNGITSNASDYVSGAAGVRQPGNAVGNDVRAQPLGASSVSMPSDASDYINNERIGGRMIVEAPMGMPIQQPTIRGIIDMGVVNTNDTSNNNSTNSNNKKRNVVGLNRFTVGSAPSVQMVGGESEYGNNSSSATYGTGLRSPPRVFYYSRPAAVVAITATSTTAPVEASSAPNDYVEESAEESGCGSGSSTDDHMNDDENNNNNNNNNNNMSPDEMENIGVDRGEQREQREEEEEEEEDGLAGVMSEDECVNDEVNTDEEARISTSNANTFVIQTVVNNNNNKINNEDHLNNINMTETRPNAPGVLPAFSVLSPTARDDTRENGASSSQQKCQQSQPIGGESSVPVPNAAAPSGVVLTNRRPSVVRGPAGSKPIASRLRLPRNTRTTPTPTGRTYNNTIHDNDKMYKYAAAANGNGDGGRMRSNTDINSYNYNTSYKYNDHARNRRTLAQSAAAAALARENYVPILPPLPPVGLAPDEVNSWLLPHVIARASVQARATANAVLRGLVHRPDRQVYRVLAKRSSNSDILSLATKYNKSNKNSNRRNSNNANNDSDSLGSSPDDADRCPTTAASTPVTTPTNPSGIDTALPSSTSSSSSPRIRPISDSPPAVSPSSVNFQSGSSSTRWAPLPADPTKTSPWMPRWFVVRHNFLFEFASRDDLLPVGCSPLSDASVHMWPRPHRDSFTLELHVDPKFASSSVGRLLLDVQCTTQREMAAMARTIQRASVMGHDDHYDISSDRLPLGSGRFARVLDVTRKNNNTSTSPTRQNKSKKKKQKVNGGCGDIEPLHQANIMAEDKNEGEDEEQDDEDISPQERCAIKLIDKRRFWELVHQGKERADTLLREITTQAMLTVVATQMPYLMGAEGIVRLLDVFETKSHIALEIELMQGGDLFHLLDKRVMLREPEAASVTAQILCALVLLHRHKIAHRDIKLTNLIFDRDPSPSASPPTSMSATSIDDSSTLVPVPLSVPISAEKEAEQMVNRRKDSAITKESDTSNNHQGKGHGQGRLLLKLADFGMATFEQNNGLLHGRCGTPGYVAPEILRAQPQQGYPNTVDVFSTGVVAYTLLCGYEPFYGANERQLIAANKRCEFAFHLPEWGNISDDAKDFVTCLMEADPAKRPTAAEALKHPWITSHVEPQESEGHKKRRFKRHQKAASEEVARQLKERKRKLVKSISGSRVNHVDEDRQGHTSDALTATPAADIMFDKRNNINGNSGRSGSARNSRRRKPVQTTPSGRRPDTLCVIS